MLTQFFSLREVTQGGKNPKTSTSHHAQNINSKNFLTVALSLMVWGIQQTKSSI